jgi:hypothetical protein
MGYQTTELLHEIEKMIAAIISMAKTGHFNWRYCTPRPAVLV